MKIEFLSGACAGRKQAQDHIRDVYKKTYGADVTEFAPLLVVARRVDGKILCAAGIKTAHDGFFSDAYLTSDVSTAIYQASGIEVPVSEIMEVVSLASMTPFPVLPLLDEMIEWGRKNGMTCGVFTATRRLRRLLKRTALSYMELASADVSKVTNQKSWGSYYETDPKVCAFSEVWFQPETLSPRGPMKRMSAEAP